MKQHLVSFGDDFTITDETGDVAYRVDGKMLSWGDKLSFQNASGTELLRIEQQVLTIGQTYHIKRPDGTNLATVRRQLFRLFGSKFRVEESDPDATGDLEAEGSFLDREYTITRDGRPAARVSKKFFSLRDAYGIDVGPGEDDALICALAVVFDMCMHDEK